MGAFLTTVETFINLLYLVYDPQKQTPATMIANPGVILNVFLHIFLPNLGPLPLELPAQEHLHIIETLGEEEEKPPVQRRWRYRAGTPQLPGNGEQGWALATSVHRLKQRGTGAN